jgi:hypothetical protein
MAGVSGFFGCIICESLPMDLPWQNIRSREPDQSETVRSSLNFVPRYLSK